MLLADVALPVPIARAFTYSVPEALAGRVAPGARVVCPFGGRRLVGVVLAVSERDAEEGSGESGAAGTAAAKTKPLAALLDDEPSVPPDLIAFLRDLAAYYFAPIGEVMRLALPPIDRDAAREVATTPSLFDRTHRPRGVGARQVQWAQPTARVEEPGTLRGQAAAVLAHVRAVGAEPVAKLESRWRNARAAVEKLAQLGLVEVAPRDAPDAPAFDAPVARDAPHEANAAQLAAIAAVVAALDEASPADGSGARARTFLLHGVTGSGKTEVYLRIMAATRDKRRGAILLVPEIALTPQLVARFRARFGDGVAVIHSGLTARERHAMWRRLRSGEVDVAIGARSALFAPVQGLGLVIVDEEHDSSFKQEEGVRYHARDMAIWRAHRAGGVCVLGSATPSLESEHLVAQRPRDEAAPPRAGARAAAAAGRDRRPAAHRRGAHRRPAHQPSPLSRARRHPPRPRAGHHLSEPARLLAEHSLPGVRADGHLRVLLGGAHLPQGVVDASAATTATSRRRSRRGARSARPRRSSSRASAPRSSRRRSPSRFPKRASLASTATSPAASRSRRSSRASAHARSTSSWGRRWSPRATTSRT